MHKPSSFWRSFRLALASLGVAGCATDSPTAPAMPDESAPVMATATDTVGGLLQKNALTRTTALTRDITVTALIGREGGYLRIPEAGFDLAVPKGAVSEPTKFTVTALRGNLVAYEFGPHGLEFNVPLRARQDLAKTTWNYAMPQLFAGYFLEKADLDPGSSKALVAESIEGLTFAWAKRFAWPISHFSGYVVAW